MLLIDFQKLQIDSFMDSYIILLVICHIFSGINLHQFCLFSLDPQKSFLLNVKNKLLHENNYLQNFVICRNIPILPNNCL